MRYAAIDIGSNSAKLLVAEISDAGQFRQIVFRHTVTGLSKTMSANNRLNPQNIALTTATIAEYLDLCRTLGVRNIRLTATQFARIAVNANELLDAITLQTGQSVDVISGDEEARLTWLAVAHDFGQERILVFNIGGGSTEFIIGTPQHTDLRISLPIGAGQLSREYLSSTDTINIDEYKKLKQHITVLIVKKILPGYLAAPDSKPARIILSGSTGTNIAQIRAGGQLDWNNQPPQTILATEVYKIEQLLRECNLKDRKALPGIEANRADVLPAGAAIASSVLEVCNAGEITITSKSLAHGIIYGLLEKN